MIFVFVFIHVFLAIVIWVSRDMMLLSPAYRVHSNPLLRATNAVCVTCTTSRSRRIRESHVRVSSSEKHALAAEINYGGIQDPEWKTHIKVAVSGAAGQICNHLLFMIASGTAFGSKQPIELQLLGSERSIQALEGVAMELEDSLYPLLRSVRIGISDEVIFQDADWVLLVGAKPRGPNMNRAELLNENGTLFERQGKVLDRVCLSLCLLC
jgi:hypothetical protein